MTTRKRRSDTKLLSDQTTLHTSDALCPSTPVVSLKVKLKRYHAVAHWTWNASDDVCGICQGPFEGTCPGVLFPGEDCPVVWGRCGHAFHLQCVSKWLQTANSKNTCALCRQPWEFGHNPGADPDPATNNNNSNSAGNAGSEGS